MHSHHWLLHYVYLQLYPVQTMKIIVLIKNKQNLINKMSDKCLQDTKPKTIDIDIFTNNTQKPSIVQLYFSLSCINQHFRQITTEKRLTITKKVFNNPPTIW